MQEVKRAFDHVGRQNSHFNIDFFQDKVPETATDALQSSWFSGNLLLSILLESAASYSYTDINLIQRRKFRAYLSYNYLDNRQSEDQIAYKIKIDTEPVKHS